MMISTNTPYIPTRNMYQSLNIHKTLQSNFDFENYIYVNYVQIVLFVFIYFRKTESVFREIYLNIDLLCTILQYYNILCLMQ